MTTSIFSTYSAGENRITSSFLAVLRSLSLDRMQRILGEMPGQPEFELIRFQKQPSKGGEGVPDAIIRSNTFLLIETKTTRNAVKLGQLKHHLDRLDNDNGILLVLTPDESPPAILNELGDSRVTWCSFSLLSQSIDELLKDTHEVVSEREEFLLRELQIMFENAGLLANAFDTVVVAARRAWQEYNDLHAYVCQPNRSFQQVSRLGFYSNGVIYPLVPRILRQFDCVEIKRDSDVPELRALINRIIDESRNRQIGQYYKFMLLSAPDSPETISLPNPIPNDKQSSTGKPTAFTMGQRYVWSEALKKARTTSELD
jgi:hypothetical protein